MKGHAVTLQILFLRGRGITISVAAFWKGEIFDQKVVKYVYESKCLKTHSFIYLC